MVDTSAETSDFTVKLERRLEALTPKLEQDLRQFPAEAVRLHAVRTAFEAQFDGMTTPITAEAGQALGLEGSNEILSYSPFYSPELQDLTDWNSGSVARDMRIVAQWFSKVWERVGARSLPIEASLYSYSYDDAEQFDLQAGQWKSL